MTSLRVRFAETDQMGVAHHAAYVVWLEAARVEWMRDRALSYRDLEASGISMAVARIDVQYRSAALFDDTLTIHTTLTHLKSRYARFAYRIAGPGGRHVASATTEHVATDRTGRAVRVPPTWRNALAAHVENANEAT